MNMQLTTRYNTTSSMWH